jgi:SAM-dependent methyltransferase
MTVPDFRARAALSEWMDDDKVDFETFGACLKDLAKVNIATLAHRPTLSFLSELARSGRWPADRPLSILDVGSGHGDALRAIDRWAARRGLAVSLTGLDRNPWAARSAAAVPSAGRTITWLTGDLFDHPGEADVIVSSLFTHHLDDDALVRFLGWMDDRAAIGWFVNDLERHPVAYYGFSLLARLARWHRFVRHDGPISIRRAFVEADWRSYLGLAGVAGARIQHRFPFRLCVAKLRHR